MDGQRRVGGEPRIRAKRDRSVSNSAWKAFFRWTWTSILLLKNWVPWISPNIWQDTVSKWTHRLLKEGMSTNNVNFCTRSRPYQREASRPSGPGCFFLILFSPPPTPQPEFDFSMSLFCLEHIWASTSYQFFTLNLGHGRDMHIYTSCLVSREKVGGSTVCVALLY